MTDQLNLAGLGGGVAEEKFQEELDRVVKNIVDPNTDWKAKRKVVIELTFRANRDRDIVEVDIASIAKLAPRIAYTTRANIGVSGAGESVALEQMNQTTIDEHIKKKAVEAGNVVTINKESAQ